MERLAMSIEIAHTIAEALHLERLRMSVGNFPYSGASTDPLS